MPNGSETNAARHHVEKLLECMLDNFNMDAFADLFDVDAVMEHPTQPPGATRKMEGREEIRRLLVPKGERARQAGIQTVRFAPIEFYENSDGRGVAAEFVSHVRIPGGVIQSLHVFVVRVGDGGIMWLRDYYDYAGQAQLLASAFNRTGIQADSHVTS